MGLIRSFLNHHFKYSHKLSPSPLRLERDKGKSTIMKTTSFILVLILSVSLGKAQNRQQVSYFPLQDVKLLDSPFLQAQQTDLHYILSMNPDRLLAPFLREAGLTPKAPSYTNWENTGLDGHIGGHYLSALSMIYAATGDTKYTFGKN